MKTLWVTILTAAVGAVAFVNGYMVDTGGRWGGARAAFQSYFDDAAAQRAVAEAVQAWQQPLEGILQLSAIGASGEASLGNGLSELAWDDLPPEVASLTRVISRSGRIIEADVAVAREGHDRARWSMESILTHELGHAVGLGHADHGGAIVRGVMATDPEHLSATLTSDDLAGVVELYRPHDLTASLRSDWSKQDVAFPPRNELFSFRQQLEKTYRYQLRRAAVTSFVDIEGTIVWTQEYLRYRVNGCTDQDAVNRVLAQIEGRGIQPVCVNFTGTTVVFPPRNEAFAFRQRLETVYRDTLRRTAVQTYVDVEGDIVWTQEYLRYRVNACSNSQAIERVLVQVGGDGVQPPCNAPPVARVTPTSIASFVSGVSVGNTQGTLSFGSRPSAGAGPAVTVPANTTLLSGTASQVGLATSEPVDTIVVSEGDSEAGASLGVRDSYYIVRLPSATTAINLTLLLPLQVPAERFNLEYAVSRGGTTFGPYRQQTVQVQPAGGDVQVSVTWDTNADLDLHIVEPGGTEIYWGNTRSAAGGELTVDSNAACAGDNIRAENTRWPPGRAPSGTYAVRVNYWADCGASPTTYIVRVVSGSSTQSFTGTFSGAGNGGGQGAGREITSFTR